MRPLSLISALVSTAGLDVKERELIPWCLLRRHPAAGALRHLSDSSRLIEASVGLLASLSVPVSSSWSAAMSGVRLGPTR